MSRFVDRQKKEERKATLTEEANRIEKERKRKADVTKEETIKKPRTDGGAASNSEISSYVDSSEKNSPTESSVEPSDSIIANDSSNEALVVDCDSPSNSSPQGTLDKFAYIYFVLKSFGILQYYSLLTIWALDEGDIRRVALSAVVLGVRDAAAAPAASVVTILI